MKISAKNYARQAFDGLRFHAKEGLELNPEIAEDYTKMLQLANQIEASEHFVLPDGGLIFDDHLKGLMDVEEIRLPYELITLSFFDPIEDQTCVSDDPTSITSKGGFGKTFVTAREHLVADLDKKGQEIFHASEKVIIFNMVARTPGTKKMWTPLMHSLVLPTNWRDPAYRRNREEGIVFVAPKVFLRNFYKEALEGIPEAEHKEVESTYIKPLEKAFRSLAEMCEALMCSNIEVIPVPQSKVRAALSKNKKKSAPTFIEKTLTILLPQKRSVYEGEREESEGKRKSPRWHMRRGHIRRLANGDKIFIESFSVGKKEDGEVKKEYKLKVA